MQHLEPLLSAQDLAEFLDVRVATIYAWRYRRQGPPGLRVGKHLRYRRADVDEWIDHRIEDSKRGLNPGSASGVPTNSRRTPSGGRAR